MTGNVGEEVRPGNSSGLRCLIRARPANHYLPLSLRKDREARNFLQISVYTIRSRGIFQRRAFPTWVRPQGCQSNRDVYLELERSQTMKRGKFNLAGQLLNQQYILISWLVRLPPRESVFPAFKMWKLFWFPCSERSKWILNLIGIGLRCPRTGPGPGPDFFRHPPWEALIKN